MSGIVGVWNLDGRPLSDGIIGRMSDALSHRGPDGEHRTVVGSLGFAHRHLWVTPEEVGEAQPVTGQGGALLMVDGRLDNRDELVPVLGLRRMASDAVVLAAAYERWDQAFVERVNGDFALAVYDPRAGRLLLARDALGVRPLYYHQGQGFIAFASEIKALLRHPAIPARPDDDGLADVLMVGSRPLDGTDVTCFAGIKALEPAHVLTVTASAVRRRRYWDFDRSTSLTLPSFADYAEAFRERFATAVRRRSRSAFPVAVSVSGGLDSSSIFCQAETLRRGEPTLFPALVGLSYTDDTGGDADEREYLARIEAEYALSISRFPLADHLGVVTGARDQLWHVEMPWLDYLWGTTVTIRRAARQRGARVLLSGHWGDQLLFSSAYLVDLCRGLAFGEMRRHLMAYRRWLGKGEAGILGRRLLLDLARAMLPRRARFPLKWVRRRLSRERSRTWYTETFRQHGLRFADRVAELGDGFHSAQARQLYLEARSKYHVQCMEWNNKAAALDGLDHAFPFLDRDLIALLIATPGRFQNHRGVPRALLREAMRGTLPEAVRARAWKADFSNAVNIGVDRDYQVIADCLGRDCAAVRRGYFDPDRLTREVARLAGRPVRSDCVASWDLTDAFGFESWLQVFFPSDRPRSGSGEQLLRAAAVA